MGSVAQVVPRVVLERTEELMVASGYDGALCGNGKRFADPQGKFSTGDRIGVLLDLDAGWMRLYRNGKRCGPGFTEGVTGPLVRAAQIGGVGEKVAGLPGAVAPEGAGEKGRWCAPRSCTRTAAS